MAREPSYPSDAPVTPAHGPESDTPPAAPSGEAVAAAAAVKGSEDRRRKKHLMTGAAIGVGSAALVAALLYAKSRGKADRS